MYSFGRKSTAILATCRPELQLLVNAVMAEQVMDFSVASGYRGEEEQDQLVEDGASQLIWPFSRHNVQPSNAVDLWPYPVDWNNIAAFKELNFLMMKHAQRLRIRIECGAYWNKPKDYPHYELA